MIKELLTRANIISGENCGRLNCASCKNTDKPQNCHKRGILYETTCLDCMVDGTPIARYQGESARGGSERIRDHMDSARSKHKDSHI